MTWGVLRSSRWGTALLCLSIASLVSPADAGSRTSTVQFGHLAIAPSSIELVVSDTPDYAYTTTAGAMTVQFPVTSTSAAVVVQGGASKPLSFTPAGLHVRDDSGSLLGTERPSPSLAFAPGNRSVTYINSYAAVSDVFTQKHGRLKHDVVLLQRPRLAPDAAWLGATYRMTLPLDYQLHAATPSKVCEPATCDELLAYGRLMVIDNAGQVHYTLGAIEVIDANGDRTDGRYRVVRGDNGEHVVSLEVAAGWLRSAAYPVTIDPTVDIVVGGGGNTIPFRSNNPEGAMLTFYTPAQIGTSGLITRIGWQLSGAGTAQTYPRIQMLMGETTNNENTLSTTYANNYDAVASVVVYDNSYAAPAGAAAEWFEIDLETPFNYSGANNLVVEVRIYGPPTPTTTRGIQTGLNSGGARIYALNAVIGAIGSKDGTNDVGYNVRLMFPGTRLINEVRIDQSGADVDHYVELIGDPGASVDDLTLLVIGDGIGASGWIENVTPLTGTFDVNGFFVVAESSFTLGTADQTAPLQFENSDNVTYLIVSGFTGSNGDDLDTDDDGVLDTMPWVAVVDSVAVIETVGSGEQVYSTTTVGPNGSFVPSHIKRCPDATGEFLIGEFDDLTRDTPGAANDCSVCGDGVVEGSEECDGDGAGTGGETATCDTDCTAQNCGDGTINTTALETCDGDGMGTGGETATCDTDCTAQSCGDGIVNTTALETCDGDGAGTSGETATCDTDCTAQSCGDGTINTTALETCDGDGMGTGGETATCDTDCTAQSCGDGIVNATALETCDGDGAGTGGETATCDTDCTAASCGDGVANATAGEDCDGDGVGTGGETAACDTDCTTATCGDGTINNTAGETCEGGKATDCDSDCTAVSCGDGHVNTVAGEECDGDGAGTPGETAACDTDCTAAMCGDAIVNTTAGEVCDDAGETSACNSDCSATSCGDGITNATAGEDCDDGAESAACNADCSASTCGDTVLNATAGETCDDGNNDDGDGCSATCIIEEPAESGGGCCDSGGGNKELPSALLLFFVAAFSLRRRKTAQ